MPGLTHLHGDRTAAAEHHCGDVRLDLGPRVYEGVTFAGGHAIVITETTARNVRDALTKLLDQETR